VSDSDREPFPLTPILLVGAGGHARACIDVIEQEGRFQVAGLVGLPQEVATTVLNYPVLGSDDDLPALLVTHRHALVTLGQIKTPERRIHLFHILLRHGCTLPAIVSPRAYVSARATIGAGTIVMHGAVVNACAAVGRNCIINSLALVEHDAIVGDHCHLATMVVVNSAVRVGEGSFIGSGSSVRQCITIGERSIIGLGQSVVADCEPGTQLPRPRKAP
jgi:sugar O-acyltransferase (sialic acid O-acetyltransferase NeuD family)